MWRMASEASLSEGERLVLKLHPHGKTLIRPAFVLVVLIAAASAALILLPPGGRTAIIRLVIGAVAVVAAFIWVLVPVLRWRTTSYELTTRRLQIGRASCRGRV